MRQLELDLNDRQLVRSASTGDLGRLDRVRGNIGFVYFADQGLIMLAVKNIIPAEHLFVWPRYYGEAK